MPVQIKPLGALRVYCDGASRGNPGPSAIAAKILDESGSEVKRFAKFLGKRTNNEAEYEALIAALELAHTISRGVVDCFLDSELVVKQLNGEYRVKNPRLKALWQKVHGIQPFFQRLSFAYVPRTDNHIEDVDTLANNVLNQALARS